MTQSPNAYSAFMLDHAAGALSPAEAMAAELHRRLSAEGARASAVLDAAGGVLLESASPAKVDSARLRARGVVERGPAGCDLDFYLRGDLLGLPWRRTFFGVQTLTTPVPRTRLLRLDPGKRAPAHGHGVRDVTLVLRGAFADAFGLYRRGDLAFAEPGVRHAPRAMGEEPCICLVAAKPAPLLCELIEAATWLGLPAR